MLEENKNLKELNTFMVPVSARYFATVKDNDSLYKILASDEWSQSGKHLILGGGSNILFVDDYNGFVLKNEIKGVDITAEDEVSVTVRVGAGENWHDFVMWSVENEYWGIENLVYIPGTVGAAPVQNIGAYGVEVKSSINSVEYISLPEVEKKMILKNECDFGYRNSIFKKNPEKYIITYVYFKLQKKANAILDYGQVSEALLKREIKNPTSKDIAEIIIGIRKSKLPEIGEIGTAGSFFKNPIVSNEDFNKIKSKFPDIKYFELEDGNVQGELQNKRGCPGVKIPAGWILDELGYKGFQDGNVGNYKNHALVITHNGKGTGKDIYNHVKNIIKKVKEVFGINLEPEVNIIKR